MAKKADFAAAKQRKQKMILIGGGVLFLALAAFQGPKLWKQLHPSTPAPAPVAAPSPAATGAPGTTPATVSVVAVHAPAAQKASLAGVVVVADQPVKPSAGQLASFSRFVAKDPFVQQEGAADATAAPATSSTPAPAPSEPSTAPATSTASTPVLSGLGGGKVTPAPLPPPTAAIMSVNGVNQVLSLKARFPKSDKVFVLVSLKRHSAKIGVVGGAYTGGAKTITLRTGRKLTLLNTATGVRYVIKLVYVGADAEQITGFSGASGASKSK